MPKRRKPAISPRVGNALSLRPPARQSGNKEAGKSAPEIEIEPRREIGSGASLTDGEEATDEKYTAPLLIRSEDGSLTCLGFVVTIAR
jgi:hypothetical protein